MILPTVIPGQHVDEALGLASGGVWQQLSASSYTVPAGYTLLIHGCCFDVTSATAGTLVVGGLTIFNATCTAASVMYLGDRHRQVPVQGSTTLMYMILNAYNAAVPGCVGMYQSGATNTFCAEHIPYLFWPLAAGQTIQVTGGCRFNFWGTLIPT
jgi:hypothetical protein